MLKYLGRFGVLAVCLFAIVIVMGGCNRDDPPPDKPTEIVKPPVETQTETPMEKLAGTYSFIEGESVVDFEVLEPPASAKFHLRPEGNGWLATFESRDGDSFGNSGPTWTANATTLTLIASDGERLVSEYTLAGKVLTLSAFNEDGARIEKWRKD